jgi:hypothetical protein
MPFSTMSKNLGIRYIEKFKKWHKDDLTRNYVPLMDGKRAPMPRYYKDKIYSQPEKDAQVDMMLEKEYEEFVEKLPELQKNSTQVYKDEIEQKAQRTKQMLKRFNNNQKI